MPPRGRGSRSTRVTGAEWRAAEPRTQPSPGGTIDPRSQGATSDTLSIRMKIPPAAREQFLTDGYAIVEEAIAPAELQMLEARCADHLDRQLADMERAGALRLGLSHKDRRYFLSTWDSAVPEMEDFLFGSTMAGIVSTFLGPDAFLFLELFVVKPPRVGTEFGWHQDSGYLMGTPHAPYLSLWCALDDATGENGALHVLPRGRAPVGGVAPHRKDKDSGDFIGYDGDDPGICLPVRAGSIIAMSSLTFHRSGPNGSDAPRRAFLASYSREPIVDAKGGLWNQAVPFLRDGHPVPRA